MKAFYIFTAVFHCVLSVYTLVSTDGAPQEVTFVDE